MSPESLIIAALGLVGALLSIAGIRVAGQLRKMRARLVTELDIRERLTNQLGELDAARGRAAEARDIADGLRREVSQTKGEVAAHKEQIERLKVDLLRANAVASDATTKRGELEAKIAALTAAAEAAEDRFHDHADLVSRARDEAGVRGEQVSKLEKQIQDLQKKLAAAQGESARLSKAAIKAEADAKAAGASSEVGLRALQAELERAKSSLADADTKHRKILEAISDEARVLREELDQVKVKLVEETKKREEAEARPAKQTGSVPPMSGLSAVAAALDTDPALNRGQRETLRMMYDKFTSKTGKG
jgi:chromosome segregation ATPase